MLLIYPLFSSTTGSSPIGKRVAETLRDRMAREKEEYTATIIPISDTPTYCYACNERASSGKRAEEMMMLSTTTPGNFQP